MAVTISGTDGITTPDIDTDGLSVDTNAIFVDPATNNVGIGTTTPGDAFADSIPARAVDLVTNDGNAEFRIINESAPTTGRFPSLYIMNYGTNANGAPALNFLRSRGTKASPLPVVNGDVLLHMNGRGQFGTASNQSRQAAFIHFRVDGNPTSTGVPGRIEFSTNVGNATLVTERMRITNTGDVIINATSKGNNGGRLHVNGAISAIGTLGRQGVNGTSNGNFINFFWTGSALEAWVDSVHVGTPVSDYRVKQKISTQTTNALDRVMQLRPISYEFQNYKNFFKADGVLREGFIAHELAEIIPSAVDGEKDDESQIQSLKLDALCSVLTKAIQEQQTIIQALTARIEALEQEA